MFVFAALPAREVTARELDAISGWCGVEYSMPLGHNLEKNQIFILQSRSLPIIFLRHFYFSYITFPKKI